LACPFELSGTVATRVAPTKNLIVPVGTLIEEMAVAVKVTLSPNLEGLAVKDSKDVGAAALFTTSRNEGKLAAIKLSSPL